MRGNDRSSIAAVMYVSSELGVACHLCYWLQMTSQFYLQKSDRGNASDAHSRMHCHSHCHGHFLPRSLQRCIAAVLHPARKFRLGCRTPKINIATGGTAPGDTIQGSDTRMRLFFRLNLQRTLDKRRRKAERVGVVTRR